MIKIAVTGPESSGKTTLSQALSKHYNVDFIPEFARAYLNQSNGKYSQSDLDKIAEGQLENIKSHSKNEILISDTDFVVMQTWSMYKYKSVSDYINQLVKNNYFDLHILCSPDIDWEFDPLRENQHDREELFKYYKSCLESFKKPYIIVDGHPDQRLKKSIEKINSILKK